MKKTLIILLAISVLAGLCACKSRTGASEQPKKQKGVSENVVVSENPRPQESPSAGKSKPESSKPAEDASEAQAAAKDFLQAVKTGSKENIQAYTDYDALFGITREQNADWQFRQILPHMSWEIISAKIDGNGAVVSVKITNIDMGVILPLWFDEAMRLEYDNALSDEPLDSGALDAKIKEAFARLLDGRSGGKVERLVDIRMEKDGGAWKPQNSGELADALTGRYFSAYSGIAGNMRGEGQAAEQAPEQAQNQADMPDADVSSNTEDSGADRDSTNED